MTRYINLGAPGLFNWIGAGYYASRIEGSSHNQRIVYYQCGTIRDEIPNTREMNLGTPVWYDQYPVRSDITVKIN